MFSLCELLLQFETGITCKNYWEGLGVDIDKHDWKIVAKENKGDKNCWIKASLEFQLKITKWSNILEMFGLYKSSIVANPILQCFGSFLDFWSLNCLGTPINSHTLQSFIEQETDVLSQSKLSNFSIE